MAELDLDAMDAFEARFARSLAAYADVPVPPVDAAAVAHDVMVGTRRRWGIVPRLARPVARVPAVAWVLLALATAVAGGLLVGALLQRIHPPARPPLVLATETGLYLGPADADPAALRLLRADGAFLLPRWSPSGDRIAVFHGPPIGAQAGTPDGLPLTGNPYDLEADELLVLDPAGATLGTVPGPFIGAAWGPPGADGASLLAARRADGSIVVVDADGALVADIGAADPVDPVDAVLLRPGLAWSAPRVLLAAVGGEVRRIDVDRPGEPATVIRVEAGRINDLAMAPDGRSLAFVVAGCRRACRGEARVARVDESPPPGSPDPPPGRGLLADVEASAAMSWTEDGGRVLAWPLVADSRGGATTEVQRDQVLDGRDVEAAWVRVAGDGSGRIVVVNSYSFFDDRHFDAWLVDPDGAAHRVAQRSLGYDLRATEGR